MWKSQSPSLIVASQLIEGLWLIFVIYFFNYNIIIKQTIKPMEDDNFDETSSISEKDQE